MRRIGFLTAFFCVTLLAGLAAAGDADDTVFLENGGRMRGTVLAEDPDSGVTLRLPDGTERVFKSDEVKKVQYGADARPSARPAAAGPPVLGAQPPGRGAPPPAYGAPPPEYGGPPPAYGAPPPGYTPVLASSASRPSQLSHEPPKHRRPAMIAGGAVMLGLGVLSLGTGAIVYASGSTCSSTVYDSTLDYTYDTYESCDDTGKKTAGATLMILGGALMAVGIPVMVIGLRKVPDQPQEAEPEPEVESRAPAPAFALSIVPSAGPSGVGLGLVGAM